MLSVLTEPLRSVTKLERRPLGKGAPLVLKGPARGATLVLTPPPPNAILTGERDCSPGSAAPISSMAGGMAQSQSPSALQRDAPSPTPPDHSGQRDPFQEMGLSAADFCDPVYAPPPGGQSGAQSCHHIPEGSLGVGDASRCTRPRRAPPPPSPPTHPFSTPPFAAIPSTWP